MITHFIVAFVLVVSVLEIFFGFRTDAGEMLAGLATLGFPGNAIWYFKIQILFYIFLSVAASINKKLTALIVLIMTSLYVIVADLELKLPDYWWKTTLCFAVGCFLAQYKDIVEKYISKTVVKAGILIVGCGAYLIVMKAGSHRVVLLLLAYVCVASCIAVMWDWLVNKGNRALEKIGRASLDIYLIHVGYVKYVFQLNMSSDIKILLFVGLVGAVTAACYFISEYIEKRLLKVVG